MILTRKSATAPSAQSRLARGLAGMLAKTIDRRSFLKRSGVAVGASASLATLAGQLPFNMIGRAEAADDKSAGGKIEVKRTVCTHCSVGCAIDAVVQNGVWVRQEPVFDSPLNLGSHCAKGAAVRDHGMTEHSHRLKYPMKLENGKYKRITWDQALGEISSKMLDLRKESGPDALYFVGSSKHNNEQAYLMRNPQWCLAQAKSIGPACLALVEILFGNRVLDHLRAAQGVIRLSDQYGRRRLETACARALSFGAPQYRTVKQILNQGLDQQPDLIESVELEAPYRGGGRFSRDPSDLLH